MEVEIKESSVRVWKGKYLAEVHVHVCRKRESGETEDLSVTSLTSKKRGRPLLLGEILDTAVKCYIRAVRDGGGIVTTSIVMAAASHTAQKEILLFWTV